MNWKAVRTSAVLLLLFVIVYGGINWLTAQRSGVGSFCLGFEQHIPFVPLLIVPYLSLDLFFIAAPFIARDERERQILARRILLAILIAGACFILFPLKFSFARPPVTGWLGVVFSQFRSMDLPYNEFPSLHIALLLILAPLYSARGGKILRALLWIWFPLIGLSTLLTYQHHIIDLVGGALLAMVCFYLAPQHEIDCLPCLPNRKVASTYFLGSVILAALAMVTRPIGLLLLWPAAAVLIAASAYVFGSARLFRKQDGKLPIATYAMFWPLLLGQHMSLLYYRRQCNAWDPLTDRVWIGRKLNDAEARSAVAAGVRSVLDLTGEFSEARSFRSIHYLQLPVMDLTAPSPEQLELAIEFIDSAPGVVYIHCKIGYSRTATVAGAYLLATGQADSPQQAVDMLRAVRPSIVIRPEAMEAIGHFHGRCISAVGNGCEAGTTTDNYASNTVKRRVWQNDDPPNGFGR